jgi:hypothetical protein
LKIVSETEKGREIEMVKEMEMVREMKLEMQGDGDTVAERRMN